MNIEREDTMNDSVRQTAALTDATISKLMETAGIDNATATAFRVVAHTVLSRNQAAYLGATSYGDSIRDEDQAMVDAGLVTLGRFEANSHPMSLSHQGSKLATLTDAGRAMATRVVQYETAIRARDMDADDFANWKRAVSMPL